MHTNRKLTPRQMEMVCSAFNRAHPIGSDIYVSPGTIDGPYEKATVIQPGAYVLSGHTPVIQVTGGHGCIALTHARDFP